MPGGGDKKAGGDGHDKKGASAHEKKGKKAAVAATATDVVVAGSAPGSRVGSRRPSQSGEGGLLGGLPPALPVMEDDDAALEEEEPSGPLTRRQAAARARRVLAAFTRTATGSWVPAWPVEPQRPGTLLEAVRTVSKTFSVDPSEWKLVQESDVVDEVLGVKRTLRRFAGTRLQLWLKNELWDERIPLYGAPRELIAAEERWRAALADQPRPDPVRVQKTGGLLAAKVMSPDDTDQTDDLRAEMALEGAIGLWELASRRANHEAFTPSMLEALVSGMMSGWVDTTALCAAAVWALAVHGRMRRELVDLGAMEGLLEACKTSVGPVQRAAESNVRVKPRVLTPQLQYWLQVLATGALSVMAVEHGARARLLAAEPSLETVIEIAAMPQVGTVPPVPTHWGFPAPPTEAVEELPPELTAEELAERERQREEAEQDAMIAAILGGSPAAQKEPATGDKPAEGEAGAAGGDKPAEGAEAAAAAGPAEGEPAEGSSAEAPAVAPPAEAPSGPAEPAAPAEPPPKLLASLWDALHQPARIAAEALCSALVRDPAARDVFGASDKGLIGLGSLLASDQLSVRRAAVVACSLCGSLRAPLEPGRLALATTEVAGPLLQEAILQLGWCLGELKSGHVVTDGTHVPTLAESSGLALWAAAVACMDPGIPVDPAAAAAEEDPAAAFEIGSDAKKPLGRGPGPGVSAVQMGAIVGMGWDALGVPACACAAFPLAGTLAAIAADASNARKIMAASGQAMLVAMSRLPEVPTSGRPRAQESAACAAAALGLLASQGPADDEGLRLLDGGGGAAWMVGEHRAALLGGGALLALLQAATSRGWHPDVALVMEESVAALAMYLATECADISQRELGLLLQLFTQSRSLLALRCLAAAQWCLARSPHNRAKMLRQPERAPPPAARSPARPGNRKSSGSAAQRTAGHLTAASGGASAPPSPTGDTSASELPLALPPPRLEDPQAPGHSPVFEAIAHVSDEWTATIAGLDAHAPAVGMMEYLVGTLWLLLCSEGAVAAGAFRDRHLDAVLRLLATLAALGSGSELQQLAVGLTWCLAELDPAVEDRLVDLGWAGSLAHAALDPKSPPDLKRWAAGALQFVSESEKHVAVMGGLGDLEKALIQMVQSGDAMLELQGSQGLARLSMGHRSKRSIVERGGVDALVGVLRHPQSKATEPTHLHALAALLNLSAVEANQIEIAKKGLYTLLRLNHSKKSSAEVLRRSSGVITNVSLASVNRTRMYKAELRYKKRLAESAAKRDDRKRAAHPGSRPTSAAGPAAWSDAPQHPGMTPMQAAIEDYKSSRAKAEATGVEMDAADFKVRYLTWMEEKYDDSDPESSAVTKIPFSNRARPMTAPSVRRSMPKLNASLKKPLSRIWKRYEDEATEVDKWNPTLKEFAGRSSKMPTDTLPHAVVRLLSPSHEQQREFASRMSYEGAAAFRVPHGGDAAAGKAATAPAGGAGPAASEPAGGPPRRPLSSPTRRPSGAPLTGAAKPGSEGTPKARPQTASATLGGAAAAADAAAAAASGPAPAAVPTRPSTAKSKRPGIERLFSASIGNRRARDKAALALLLERPKPPPPEPPVKVLVAPLRPRQFTFEHGVSPWERASVDSLTIFEHVDGALGCDALFPHFELPNGKLAHFFHADKGLIQETYVGPLQPPGVPIHLEDLLHERLPATGVLPQTARPPAQLTGSRGFVAARPTLPVPQLCPLPHKHTLPVKNPYDVINGWGDLLDEPVVFELQEIPVEVDVLERPVVAYIPPWDDSTDAASSSHGEDRTEHGSEDVGSTAGGEEPSSPKSTRSRGSALGSATERDASEAGIGEDEDRREEREDPYAIAWGALTTMSEPWSLERGLFGARALQSDARDFFDSRSSEARQLQRDWARLLDKKRFVSHLEAEARALGHPVPLAQAELRECVREHYRVLEDAWMFYVLVLCGGKGSLAAAEFARLMDATDIPRPSARFCKAADCAAAFAASQSDQDTVPEELRQVLRSDFLECLIRLAIAKFAKGNPQGDISDALEALVTQHLRPWLQREALLGPAVKSARAAGGAGPAAAAAAAAGYLEEANDFRAAHLYCEEVDLVLREVGPILEAVFRCYAATAWNARPLPVPVLPPGKLQRLLEDAKLMGEGLCSKHDARVLHARSVMRVLNEQDRGRTLALTFTDFCEALVRLADIADVPSTAQMEAYGVDHVHEYFSKFGEDGLKKLLAKSRAELAERPEDRPPLHEKLRSLLDLLLRNLDFDAREGDASLYTPTRLMKKLAVLKGQM